MFFVSSMHSGGSERIAALLCNHWARQGYTVVLMPTFSGRGECLYPIDSNVTIDYLADRIPGRKKTLMSMARRFFALRKAVAEHQPDVIISFITHVNISVLLATIGMTTPVVVSERSYPPLLPLSLFWKILRKLVYKRARSVVALTKDTAQWLVENCPGSKVTVIPNPVVLPLPSGPPELEPEDYIDTGRKVLLSAGRLSEEKGFEGIIKAFQTIISEVPDWDLVIVGDGPLHKKLIDQCNTSGVQNRVFFPGQAGNMEDWYRRADIYVLNSQYEGFPNGLVEAMAHGAAPVSMRCKTGPADIIKSKSEGVLVSPASGMKGLSDALLDLMMNEDRRKKIGQNAQIVASRFSIDRIEALWQEVFWENQ